MDCPASRGTDRTSLPRTRRRLSAAALVMTAGLLIGTLGGCFENSPPVDPVPGDGSTSMPPPGAVCVPGTTQSCLCAGGSDGVQACNAEGSGYSECDCTSGGGTLTSTTMGPDDTTAGPDDTTAGPADTGPVETTDSPTTGGPASEYRPCPGGLNDCDGDTCLAPGGYTVCGAPCVEAMGCPPVPDGGIGNVGCLDLDLDGSPECVLLCDGTPECPPGMECFIEFSPPICMWGS